MAERQDGNRLRAARRRGRQRLGHVRWEAFTHRHLWNMIMDAHPDEVFERHREWRELGRTLVDVNTTVQTELNTLFVSWRGSAAVTAAISNTNLLAWAQEAAETTQEVGEQLGNYGNALVEARKRMPQPRPVDAERAFHSGDSVEVLNGPENAYVLMALLDDNQYTDRQSREARLQAIEVMRAFEVDARRVETQVDQSYGTPPPTAVTGGGGITPAVPPPPVPLPPSGGPPPGVPPSPAYPGSPATTSQQGAGPVATGSGVSGPAGIGGFGTGALGGAAAGAGAGADAVYGGRGLAGAVGAGGGPGAMGRGIGGLPGGAAAEGAAARGAAGAAGGSGRGGMLYPPMGGGLGARDDDQEKRLAAYVVADDDLFDDDRPVAPPVFGA